MHTGTEDSGERLAHEEPCTHLYLFLRVEGTFQHVARCHLCPEVLPVHCGPLLFSGSFLSWPEALNIHCIHLHSIPEEQKEGKLGTQWGEEACLRLDSWAVHLKRWTLFPWLPHLFSSGVYVGRYIHSYPVLLGYWTCWFGNIYICRFFTPVLEW